MPILANALIAPLEDDIDRYAQIIGDDSINCGVMEHDGITYEMREFQDTEITGLEDCRVRTLNVYGTDEIVYSCYFKSVRSPTFGQRVVQVEVRTQVPGLARAVMRNQILQRGRCLRSDISNTPAGRKMWERFIQQGDFNFYLADLSIDLRKPYGAHNQDANQIEIFQNLRPYDAKEKVWHDNRQGDVIVVYATTERLL
jgi:hypothetical protein